MTGADGRTVTALVFVMDPEHALYEADSCPKTIAPLIAQAKGPLGTTAQYLFSLEQEQRGMYDDCLTELIQQVRDLQSCQRAGGTG